MIRNFNINKVMLITRHGFSLLECLLALTLSVVLLQSVLVFFTGFTHQMQQLAERQCELSAMESFSAWFSHSIRYAGFRGCRRLVNAPVVLPFNDLQLTPETALHIMPQAWQVRYADPQTAAAVLAIKEQRVLYLTDAQAFSVGDPVLIADCTHAELNRMVRCTKQQIELAQPLTFTYEQAEVFVYRDETYFLRANTLFRQDAAGRHSALLKNITALQVVRDEQGVAANISLQCARHVAKWSFREAIDL